MNYTYLTIDICTVIVPFAFSFHPRLNFYKTWKAFFPAVTITGIIFLIWDILFTHLGIWGFNPRYLTGIQIANLPIEEILFFLCIPYACVFTWHCLNLFLPESFSESLGNKITFILILLLLITGILFFKNLYTAVTFLSLAAVLAITAWGFKIKWLLKFYIVYTVLLLPFLLVNGILTGLFLDQPVVWYNSSGIIGLRILTIPVEDVFYGMELILINVFIYEHLKSKKFLTKSTETVSVKQPMSKQAV
jgi:lycopene cyclase domain-containing protein